MSQYYNIKQYQPGGEWKFPYGMLDSTKRIQFTAVQLDYLTSLVEKDINDTPLDGARDYMLNIAQNEVLDKLNEGYNLDENGEEK